MSTPKLGSGARMKALTDELARRRGVRNPQKLAAFIGDRKYGKARMAQMAAAGRNRAAG